jgi:N-methylhydantoinase A/oxoprolinase/acetone carboxylase beta subunit/N-methylhydantoinase B/oxoprolinase/acetone carboxylase alpha subunit
MTTPVRHRLAADIGGTFTDVVLDTGARRFSCKVLTTPRQPELGVLEGIARLLRESGAAGADVGVFVHGTTLATNALIERKGARTALLTTEGFRDVLEMGYEKRFDQYDVEIERPPALVPRPLRFTVRERIAADGTVLVALDEAGVRDAALRMRAADVQAVAIGLLHAYAHPAHEQRARAIVAEVLGAHATVCLSSEVCPEMREYERLSTTVANAYVRPLMAGYLQRLSAQLAGLGLRCPLLLMMSGGGLTTLEQAARFPIRLVESGPAGGAILAAGLARACGLADAMAFDMGGTTAKVCLISGGEPERARRFEVGRSWRNMKGSGLPVRIPVIELVEIGAGGGSIGRVDAMSRITVGPDSCGAEPGPACYGRGGTLPAVTDANLALGRIEPARFAGGRIALDATRAHAALHAQVGAPLGLDARWAAAGISEIVEENMANAARVHAIERGRAIGEYTMIAFGGGAPLHAGRVAQKLGIARVLVPGGAGVGSAIGFLRAPVSYEVVRSDTTRLADCDPASIDARLHAMQDEAAAVVEPAAGGAPLACSRRAELRYAGQGHELRVEVPEGTIDRAALDILAEGFERLYEAVYGLRIAGSAVEVVTWSVTLATRPDPLPAVTATGPTRRAAPSGTREAWEPARGAFCRFALHAREALAPGDLVAGPALIAEDETTTVVPADWQALVDAAGNLVMTAQALGLAVETTGPQTIAVPAEATHADAHADAHATHADAHATHVAPHADALRAIRTQVMWNRLVSVVEEQAQALLRTAFGSVAREAGDLSAGVYDVGGRMLAQAVTGTPGHVNSMATAVGHFLERFPATTMRPGDVFVTNDPWLGTGHLFDYVVVTPVFRERALVALFASTCHTIDVGGIGFSADARSVFEEGTCIPHLRLARDGALNEDVLAIIAANSRNPVESRGDILSLVSCNEVGARRLLDMMDEFALASIEPLAAHILEQSRAAARVAIARLPSGSWRASMTLDGYEQPIELHARLSIDGDRLSVDYAGSSPASARGINSPKCYTDAYSVFGLKCLIAPEVPNNAGSLEPFEVLAPPGSAVHPLRPSPVTARHVIGQMLPDLMFGCLDQALDAQVPAESAGSIWVLAMSGTGPQGAFNVMNVGLGGMGARARKDGLATTAFPSGVGGIPVEVTETQAPVVFWHKEYLPDSGGAGTWRGGLAQRIVVGGRTGVHLQCAAATFDRRAYPARGRQGGLPGAPGRVIVESPDGDRTFEGKGTIDVPPGARLRVDLPGGGGVGDPRGRERARLDADLRDGLISEAGARGTYGVGDAGVERRTDADE